MNTADVLVDAFQRVRDAVHPATNGLSREELAYRPDPESNSIAWLVWHLTRVQDDHVADLAGSEQVWTSSGWAERFALLLPTDDTGYGHSPDEVTKVVADASSLLGYFEDVHAATLSFVGALGEEDADPRGGSAAGTRRSPSEPVWSAWSRTTSSTRVRRPTSAASSCVAEPPPHSARDGVLTVRARSADVRRVLERVERGDETPDRFRELDEQPTRRTEVGRGRARSPSNSDRPSPIGPAGRRT